MSLRKFDKIQITNKLQQLRNRLKPAKKEYFSGALSFWEEKQNHDEHQHVLHKTNAAVHDIPSEKIKEVFTMWRGKIEAVNVTSYIPRPPSSYKVGGRG